MLKLVDVTPNAVVRRLPRTLPVMKLAMCKLISMPNTVASTPYREACPISAMPFCRNNALRPSLVPTFGVQPS